jgi:hypothetical protein
MKAKQILEYFGLELCALLSGGVKPRDSGGECGVVAVVRDYWLR